MLTPLDIENKEFKKGFRGYNIDQVEEFLDQIIEDYEKVYRENVELKDKVNLYSAQISYYNTMEETLKETLITAQTNSEDIISTARKKSKNITDEAELKGERIVQIANEKVRDIREEYESLKKEMLSFKTRYQTFIEAQLLSLERFHKEASKDSNEESKTSIEKKEIKENKKSEFANKETKGSKVVEKKETNKEKDKLLKKGTVV